MERKKDIKLNNNHDGTISVTLSKDESVIEKKDITTLEFYDKFADKKQLISDYTQDAFENGAIGVSVNEENGSVFAAYGVNDDGSFYGVRIEADIDKVRFSDDGRTPEYDRAVYRVDSFNTDTIDNERGQKVRYNSETKEFFVRTGTRKDDIKYLKPEKVFASDGNLNYDKDAAIRKNYEKRHKVDKLVTNAGETAQNHTTAIAGGIMVAKKLGDAASKAANLEDESDDPDFLKNVQDYRAIKKGVKEFGDKVTYNHEEKINQYKKKTESREKDDIFKKKAEDKADKLFDQDGSIGGGRNKTKDNSPTVGPRDIQGKRELADKEKSKEKNISKDKADKSSKLNSKLDKFRGQIESDSLEKEKRNRVKNRKNNKSDKVADKAIAIASASKLAQSDNVARDVGKIIVEHEKKKLFASFLAFIGGNSFFIVFLLVVVITPALALLADVGNFFSVDIDGLISLNAEEQQAAMTIYRYLTEEQGIEEETAICMAAGITGNLMWESGGMIPNNAEDAYLISDELYTENINNGSYSKNQFSYDHYGYGIAQWTYSSRKRGLYDYAVSYADRINRPFKIDSLAMQVEYVLIEAIPEGVHGYTCSYHDYQSNVIGEMKNAINNANSVNEKIRQAAHTWMVLYENPGIPHEDERVLNASRAYIYLTYAITGEMPEGAGGGSWLWPVPGNYSISSPFGPRWGSFHRGVDIPCSVGTQVIASNGGTVTIYPNGSFDPTCGNALIIDCGNGTKNMYYHLSGYAVANGTVVTAGQVIAYSGNTGFSTGPHLHFGVQIDGTYVDPQLYISPP